MNRKTMRSLCLLTVLLQLGLQHYALAGNTSKGTGISTMPQISATKELADSIEQLGIEIYKKLSSTNKLAEKDCFISPASIGIALHFIAAASDGETRKALFKALHVDDAIASDPAAIRVLMQKLGSDDPQVTLEIANALFIDQQLKAKETFLASAQENFLSEIKKEDFKTPQALADINNWVSAKTHGHIKKLVDKLPKETVAALLNAVYFSGKWQSPFQRNLTQEADFHLANGSTSKLPTMNMSDSFDYLENPQFQAVRMPYGGGRYNALVFLPQPGVKLETIRNSMSNSQLQNWLDQFRTKKGSLRLPRFDIEFGTSLNEVLKQLGFEVMFSSGANFGKLAAPPPPLHISEVIHKTTLHVDEEGTVATAVTGGVMKAMAMRREPPPFVMIVDRPFIFAVVDSATGLPLFLGSVYEPKAATH